MTTTRTTLRGLGIDAAALCERTCEPVSARPAPFVSMRWRTIAVIAAAVPVTACAAAVVLKKAGGAGGWRLYIDRHRIELSPVALRSCPRCHGDGGWQVGGPFPEMEACPCWADRRELHISLLPIPSRHGLPF